jgi:hypothetical protein
MNVEIGAEAALFPEYIKGIFVAVWEVDIIAAWTSFISNADASDSERRRVFFNYTVSQLLPGRWVVRFAKHGALHPYVLGSKLKEDRA